jgi:arylsulfatase A-like enzyme
MNKSFTSIIFGGMTFLSSTLVGYGIEPKHPNILILLTDDQRWDAMACAGNNILLTREMDRLAREGTMFVNAFVTSSISAASRASIFTGLYERTHGCNFNTGILSRSQLEKSYPMLLRSSGYYTGFIGKYGVGDGKREIEGEEVFDSWKGFYGQGEYFPSIYNGKHLNEVMVEQAKEFFDSVPVDKPWCLSVSFKAPHSGRGYVGYEAERDFKELYEDITIPAPPTAKEQYYDALPEFLKRCNARTNYWQQRFSSPELYQSIMKDYYRLITGADRAIGRIREELVKRGIDNNTVIIFLSDNGDMMGDYMLGGKELLFDVSIRVPLIVFDPRKPIAAQGHIRTEMVLNIDIAPTVLDLAGIPIPESMQGLRIIPLVYNKPFTWRKDFFCENNFCNSLQYYPMIEGIRNSHWKYIRYIDIKPVYEQLFNLKKDPYELNDLAGTKKYKAILNSLRLRCNELKGKLSNH